MSSLFQNHGTKCRVLLGFQGVFEHRNSINIAIAAVQDLAAQIKARAELLAEEQCLLVVSIERAALWGRELLSIIGGIKSGTLALAAYELNKIQPETNDQMFTDL